MKSLLFLLLLTGLISCSGSKSTSNVEGEEAGVELADADEFADEASEDVVAGNLEDGMVEGVEGAMEEGQDAMAAAAPTIDENAVGEESIYTVQKNETLMMIAFKIYGDYGKWKELSKINGTTSIKEGMQIKYNKPAQPFVWSPEGNPYLIRSGDTLGTISNTTYGTVKYWKNIWHNNEPLIKDPNKIFAGFTIYTPVIDGRDVANNDLSDL